MITLSNSLSFVRAPLALLFCQESPTVRIFAVILAIITDSVDGYIARRSKSVSRFGAILDPVMDKFFVLFSVSVLLGEGRIAPMEMVAMLSRDFAILIYCALMFACGRWKEITIRACRWGKISTSLQFLVLIALCLNVEIPLYFYGLFVGMGTLVFLELIQRSERTSIA
jgi:CDP-diacylglycerol--glycerol-3-phosphate 3-phosphatidyltransferase